MTRILILAAFIGLGFVAEQAKADMGLHHAHVQEGLR